MDSISATLSQTFTSIDPKSSRFKAMSVTSNVPVKGYHVIILQVPANMPFFKKRFWLFRKLHTLKNEHGVGFENFKLLHFGK